MCWKADENGNVSETNDLATLQPVVYGDNSIFPSKTTTEIKLQANLSANATDRLNVGLPFVDQEGNSRSLTMGFTRTNTGSGEWTLDMTAKDAANQPVDVIFDPPTLTFDGTGNLTFPTDGLINVDLADQFSKMIITQRAYSSAAKVLSTADEMTMVARDLKR